MNTKLLVAASFFVFLAACSSNVPDPRGIPEGEQKERAVTLSKRNAEDDASAFYHVGGIGYLMTSGGLRMPIGVDTLDSRDFQSLEPFAPILFSEISPLLVDSEGSLTMGHFLGDLQLSEGRQFYYDVRGDYAERFNRSMLNLSRQ